MEKDYSVILLENMKNNNLDHIIFEGKEEDINEWDFDILDDKVLEEGYNEWKRRNDNGNRKILAHFKYGSDCCQA